MSDSETMGRNKYARHRGCSPNAILKAARSGRITAAVSWKETRIAAINWRLADQLWAENTTPRMAPHPGVTAGAKNATRDGTYSDARLARERANAKLAELKYLCEIGRVVAVDDVRRSWERRLRMMRDQLLDIPARVSSIVAAESDSHRVEALLTEEITKILHELADADDGTSDAKKPAG